MVVAVVAKARRLIPLCTGLHRYDKSLSTHGRGHGTTITVVELVGRAPVLLAGDAADLQENLDDNIAPGLLWRKREDLARESIQRLKDTVRRVDGWLWRNHDLAPWARLRQEGWSIA